MKLTRNFWKDEFTCKCGCGFNNISTKLVGRLQLLRDRVNKATGYDVPFIVNSGCRCLTHNKAEGGSDNSAHLYGLAVDIECTNSFIRYLVTYYALMLGFKRIGIHSSFLHLDLSEELPQPRVWVY